MCSTCLCNVHEHKPTFISLISNYTWNCKYLLNINSTGILCTGAHSESISRQLKKITPQDFVYNSKLNPNVLKSTIKSELQLFNFHNMQLDSHYAQNLAPLVKQKDSAREKWVWMSSNHWKSLQKSKQIRHHIDNCLIGGLFTREGIVLFFVQTIESMVTLNFLLKSWNCASQWNQLAGWYRTFLLFL